MQDYRLVEHIGMGTYGEVYRALDLRRQQMCAIKRIRYSVDSATDECTEREIHSLRRLRHPNIVQVLHIIIGKVYVNLVFPLATMDLYKRMRSPISPKLAQAYAYQLIQGLAYLHAMDVMHRDLKPGNLLIYGENNERLCIADFGLSKIVAPDEAADTEHTIEVVTLWYRPPEILLHNGRYGKEVDIWSAGCIFAELLTTAPLFGGDSEIGQIMRIFEVLGTPVDGEICALEHFQAALFPKWPSSNAAELASTINIAEGARVTGVGDLVVKMLGYAPKKRPTACEVLAHAFFSDFIVDLIAYEEL
jgi:serine/threonine protein kinase